MNKKVLIINPLSYIGATITEGHMKDTEVIRLNLESRDIEVDVIYSKGIWLYDSSGHLIKWGLLSLVLGRAHINSRIFISPLHRLRPLVCMLIHRNPVIYVADSILKTSIYAAVKNVFYLHRVIYSLIVEKIMGETDIIVSSLEEYSWYSSCGKKTRHCHLIQPVPTDKLCIIGRRKISSKINILIYNPSGDGIDLAHDIIDLVIELKLEINIFVTGGRIDGLRKDFASIDNVLFPGYVENIADLIVESDCVVITDIGGSGTCNRTQQARFLGTPVISTYDGLRGTNLSFDEAVFVFNKPKDVIEVLNKEIYPGRRSASDRVIENINASNDALDRLVTECFTFK